MCERKVAPPCHACGQPASALCDAPGCDRPCCPACHLHVDGGREALPGDFCHAHAGEALLAALRARGFALEAGAGDRAGRLLVTPGSALTAADREAISRWKSGVLAALAAEAPPADPPAPAPAGPLTDDDMALIARLVAAEPPPLARLAAWAAEWEAKG